MKILTKAFIPSFIEDTLQKANTLGLAQAFLFDMDGTLLDSEKVYMRSRLQAASELGLSLPPNAFYEIIGLSEENCQRALRKWLSTREVTTMATRYLALDTYYFAASPVPLKPGVLETLQYLQKRAIPCAVATSTEVKLAKEHLVRAGINRFFKEIIGGDQVKRGKPFPDIFLKTAERLGVLPQECVVLEDSFNGIKAAEAAGMIPIMIPDFKPPTPDIRRRCYQVFSSMKELLAFYRLQMPLRKAV